MKKSTDHASQVQDMFSRIATNYDLLNRLMTLGQDKFWRREAVSKLALKPHTRLLDIGTGTGDLAIEIKHNEPQVEVIASDFTLNMVRLAKQRPGAAQIHWVIADAQNLPFEAQSCQGAISGFLLRNVSDLERTLTEQKRVLAHSGLFVSLDTTPPARNMLRPFILFYLNRVVPLLGKLISKESEAYFYLPDSTKKFLPADKLAERIQAAGFKAVSFKKKMFGTVAIHWGERE